jgi:hypothetical protein
MRSSEQTWEGEARGMSPVADLALHLESTMISALWALAIGCSLLLTGQVYDRLFAREETC